MAGDDDLEVAVIASRLECIECGRRWANPSERWRMYITDDQPPEGVLYCRTCASREFDP